MLKELLKSNNEKVVFYLLFVIFILTEIIDVFLDYKLGDSLLHSLLQLFLFLSLFTFTYKIFLGYSKKKMNRLIPEELMNILKIIKNSEQKGILVNQRKMREMLKITKPTLKKRVDILIELQYLFFEERGNHKYFRITPLGHSLFD